MSWPKLLLGAVGLALLEMVVSNPAAYGRVGSWAAGAGGLVNRFVDPTVPAIGPAPTPAASPSPPGGGGHVVPASSTTQGTVSA